MDGRGGEGTGASKLRPKYTREKRKKKRKKKKRKKKL